MNSVNNRVALDEDFHVHSTFSDGASTLAENVEAAQDRELRTRCLVDHVRRDTAWVPDFTLGTGFRSLPAHLFSVLPKIGLTEAMVPDSLLAHLAKQVAHTGTMVEVNEKWSCPSARTVTSMAAAGVALVAGSDSHHCRNIGIYDSVRQTVSAVRV